MFTSQERGSDNGKERERENTRKRDRDSYDI